MTENADVLANFSKAFYARFVALTGGVHNSFYLDVTGRLYEDQAPENSEYPYAVYQIISAPLKKTFSEEYTDMLVQLDIFSSASSSAEIKNASIHAKTLYDEQSLTITGATLVWMRQSDLVPMLEEHTTAEGTIMVRHYAIELEVRISLN